MANLNAKWTKPTAPICGPSGRSKQDKAKDSLLQKFLAQVTSKPQAGKQVWQAASDSESSRGCCYLPSGSLGHSQHSPSSAHSNSLTGKVAFRVLMPPTLNHSHQNSYTITRKPVCTYTQAWMHISSQRYKAITFQIERRNTYAYYDRSQVIIWSILQLRRTKEHTPFCRQHQVSLHSVSAVWGIFSCWFAATYSKSLTWPGLPGKHELSHSL